MQQQYATISVANQGPTRCWLVGYAQVVLLAGGAPLGRPAVPDGITPTAVALGAGQSATASLHGPSTCNAGVSDQVRISAAGTAYTDVALPMRACSLTIGTFLAA